MEDKLMEKEGVAAHVDPPTQSATMTIKVGPDKGWGTAKGVVPGDQAHHFITTVGIMGTVCGGIGGAVFISRDANADLVAFAALVLALIGAVLIAACSLARTRHEARVLPHEPVQPKQPGKPEGLQPLQPRNSASQSTANAADAGRVEVDRVSRLGI
jgi:uncharacterized membrane protein YeaQ/YmgE (transglycosylase-associated protein family)